MLDPELSKSKIRWQCRRGMLELDYLLQRFVDDYYDSLSMEEKATFASLLQSDDPMLWDWLVEEHAHPKEDVNAIIQKIIK